jgi:hypothetical protein
MAFNTNIMSTGFQTPMTGITGFQPMDSSIFGSLGLSNTILPPIDQSSNTKGIFDKIGGVSSIFEGLQGLASLYGAYQQNKLANKAFKTQQQNYTDNVGRQTKIFNDNMADTLRARASAEGRDPASADALIAQRRL